MMPLKMDTITGAVEDDKSATVENLDLKHQSIKEESKKCDVGTKL